LLNAKLAAVILARNPVISVSCVIALLCKLATARVTVETLAFTALSPVANTPVLAVNVLR